VDSDDQVSLNISLRCIFKASYSRHASRTNVGSHCTIEIMLTRKIIGDLDIYLTTADHYPKTVDSGDNNELNKIINDNWRDKIEKSLTEDFRQLLANQNLKVEQTKSIFYIEDNDAQGATIWKSFVTLTDKEEKMDVVINFVVNHNNAFIYLGTSHTNLEKYTGTSEILKGLFKQLKTNEKVGHFFQTKFYDLNSRSATATNNVHKSWRGLGWLQKLFS
jgi:hypothetical protein